MMDLKWITSLLLCVFLAGSGDKGKYVVKVRSSCSFDGSKLALLPYHPPKGYEPHACSYEQDKLFGGYPHRERIKVLAELLGYEGDTSLCSKKVCRYGSADAPRPVTTVYSTQIDALYLLTTLAVGAYSRYYCPYPVLVDTVTGKEINDSPKQVAEVYAIYRAWFKASATNGFVNFQVPLRNSRYAWYGIRKDRRYMLEDTFKVPRLDQSFAVVGRCLD